MNKFFFDVDGVLCDTGCKINESFKEWFLNWTKDKEYYIVTGGERQSTIDQIGEEIVRGAKISFHCMGNQIYIEDREYRINQFQLTSEEIDWLNKQVLYSEYHTKIGNHIEIRHGSINFSILGRNASTEQRNEYYQWDLLNRERISVINKLCTQFPRLEAFVGGNTSIDICLRGANKGQVLDLTGSTRDNALFFGDKCFFLGIDNPIAQRVNKFYQITSGYTQTQEILSQL